MHVGVAGGRVVAGGTGSMQHREYTVTGETVNLAGERALAAFGRGQRDPGLAGQLRGLKEQGELFGLRASLPAIEAALDGLAFESRPTCRPEPSG